MDVWFISHVKIRFIIQLKQPFESYWSYCLEYQVAMKSDGKKIADWFAKNVPIRFFLEFVATI